jgi:hypothetical protein
LIRGMVRLVRGMEIKDEGIEEGIDQRWSEGMD